MVSFSSKRQRIPKPKQAMLRAVYHDNLRLAGKVPEQRRHSIQWPGNIKRRRIIPVVLVVIFCVFSELDPSLSVHGPSLLSASDTAQKIPNETAYNSQTAAAPVLLPPDPVRDYGMFSMGIWNDILLMGQRPPEFGLLLPPDDHVRLSSLFGLQIKTIVIDAGHGGIDPGAIGAMGIREKDITLGVALRLKERLNAIPGLQVLLTRSSDITLSLAERVTYAGQNQADLFISVHVNSLPNQIDNVIETYYFGPPLSSETLKLAETENRGSSYSIMELDTIIEDIGNTVKRQESARLAAAIQESLYRNVKSRNAAIRDFGVKMAPFVVLSQVEVPSVLVEISCLTNKEEEAKLASAQYRDQVAGFIHEGIAAYLERQQFKLLYGEKQNEPTP